MAGLVIHDDTGAMKASKFMSVIASASLALTGCMAYQASTTRAQRGEAELARMLEGRVAGSPRSCISAMVDNKLKIIDQTALVYDAGNTIWVARPSDPSSLDTRDILIIERISGQLCKQDIVRTVDQTSGLMTGVVFLGDFVPYRTR